MIKRTVARKRNGRHTDSPASQCDAGYTRKQVHVAGICYHECYVQADGLIERPNVSGHGLEFMVKLIAVERSRYDGRQLAV